MSAREKAVEVLEAAAAGERRGPHFGEAVVSVLRDHGLVVVHAADVAARGIVLDRAETALRDAVTAQRHDQSPDHGQFYAWGWLLTAAADHLAMASAVIATQVGQYGQRHTLRDDDGMDPSERIDRAYRAVDAIRGYADGASVYAARFHSEVGHIAVEQPPAPEGEEPT